MNNVNLDGLKDSPLFKGLAAKEMELFGTFLTPQQISAGKTIYIENMTGESLYLLSKGAVRISQMLAEGDEQTLVILGPGDTFGELAVIDGGPRAATARVVEDVSLFALLRKDYYQLCNNNPRLGMQLTLNLFRSFSERLRRSKQDYRNMLIASINRKKQ
ncbi:MAG: cyclic nucleotide-binding domain-containing protein [Desulfuromonadales bacterium]|nr:cyclic nucleotide-binding domain-containing protein [Desulfuromonadales bacterium]